MKKGKAAKPKHRQHHDNPHQIEVKPFVPPAGDADPNTSAGLTKCYIFGMRRELTPRGALVFAHAATLGAEHFAHFHTNTSHRLSRCSGRHLDDFGGEGWGGVR